MWQVTQNGHNIVLATHIDDSEVSSLLVLIVRLWITFDHVSSMFLMALMKGKFIRTSVAKLRVIWTGFHRPLSKALR